MRFASILAISVVAASVSCGGVDPAATSMQVSFRKHALKCDRPGMRARLEVIGAPPCLLEVSAENQVSGVCTGIPTGQQRQFRLVYFTDYPGDPPTIDLATALETVDLTDQTDPDLLLVFDRIDNYPDDDRSGGTNLEEWCLGTDPRG